MDDYDDEEAPVHFPLDDWQDVAMVGAISEEIAEERNRRRQNLKEDSQRSKNNNNQAGSAIPKTDSQINNDQNKSNFEGIITIAVIFFIIFLLAKACSG
jgi:hypothetical protein